MCDIEATVKDGKATIICKISGKPIIESNDYGMFCEDMCELEESKALSSLSFDEFMNKALSK
jgi:hypothetical protein